MFLLGVKASSFHVFLFNLSGIFYKTHASMKPRRPPMTKHTRPETAFRQAHASERPLHGICMHSQKSKHLLGSKVRWCDHRLARTPKEAFSQVRVHAGTANVDFEVDRQPPADSPPGDHLITMVKETVKGVTKNEKRSEACSYLS